MVNGKMAKSTVSEKLPVNIYIYIFPDVNGVIYNGNWVEGVPTGKGKIEFTNGSFYEGDVEKGAPHG